MVALRLPLARLFFMSIVAVLGGFGWRWASVMTVLTIDARRRRKEANPRIANTDVACPLSSVTPHVFMNTHQPVQGPPTWVEDYFQASTSISRLYPEETSEVGRRLCYSLPTLNRSWFFSKQLADNWGVCCLFLFCSNTTQKKRQNAIHDSVSCVDRS
jgi:hypothetical protein